MKIQSLEMNSLRIPFRMKFVHHSAERVATESVIVTAISSRSTGFGEGCPRVYVTGETAASAQTFFQKYHPSLLTISSMADLARFRGENSECISQNPAAWCAIEMALLDLISRDTERPLASMLTADPGTSKLRGTAVLGMNSITKIARQALAYRAMGFTEFKLKLSGDVRDDLRALQLLRYLGLNRTQVRLDGNNLWKSADEAIPFLVKAKHLAFAVEEPLQANDFIGMKRLADITGLKIILDESFLSAQTLPLIAKDKMHFILNLRLSKLGGALTTLELIEHLEREGYQYSIGAHVGETSLLTKAGFFVARRAPSLRAFEGGLSGYLLQNDPFTPSLRLGWGGRFADRTSSQILGWGISLKGAHG